MAHHNFANCYQKHSVASAKLVASVALPTPSELLFLTSNSRVSCHVFFSAIELINSRSNNGFLIIVIHQNTIAS